MGMFATWKGPTGGGGGGDCPQRLVSETHSLLFKVAESCGNVNVTRREVPGAQKARNRLDLRP